MFDDACTFCDLLSGGEFALMALLIIEGNGVTFIAIGFGLIENG
jgi:hypothetical protein